MKRIFIITAAVLIAVSAAQAQEPNNTAILDKIWSYATLYQNEDAKALQSLKLTGRLQGDVYNFNSEDNGSVNDLNWRRFRLGAKAVLLNDFLIHVEADLDPNNIDNSDFYKGLTDAYIAWSRSKPLKLKVGKQSAGFTLDGATSSKELLTMERSIVADNLWFTSEYFTGISASGKIDGWKYNLGAFSSSGDAEFGEFDSGWFGLASLGHAVSDSTDLRLDYVHNEPDYTGEVGTKKLTDIVSFVSQSKFGQVGFDTDVSFAKGDDDAGQSDMMGLQLMPYWDINDRWQGVFRYSMVHCTDGPGASLGRYPKKFISGSKYEDMQDFYLGVNCYLYGQKLKWQTGIEYNLAQNDATGIDYNGWGVSSGIRLSW